MKILNKEEHFDYVSDLASRHSLPEMQEITGIGMTTLCSFINEHGIVLKSKEKHLKLVENVENIKEDAKLLSISLLSEKYGVSKSKMRRFMDSLGVPTKEKELELRIVSFLQSTTDKLTLQELISKFDCHRSVIERISLKVGYELRPTFRLESIDTEIRKVLSETYLNDAARILGVNATSLSQYARRNNIDILDKPLKEKLPGHIVYAYYDREGVVRYYGEGSSEDRAYQFNGHKSKGYDKYFSEYPPDVEILYYGLSKEDALKIEQNLVTENLETIATVYNCPKTNKRKRQIPYDIVSTLMYVDASSPSGLRWKEGVESYGNRVANTVVGFKSTGGYWTVKLSKYGQFKTHCIVWLLENKSMDVTKATDHIDCNKDNNCISNLREVSHSFNNKNKRTNSNTGLKGVSWHQSLNRYSVTWSVDGSRKHKIFTIAFYKDKDTALQEAVKFRDQLLRDGLIILTPNCK